MIYTIKLRVNGREHVMDVQPHWSLAYVLRDKLGLTGTKIGCAAGTCGTCTVIVDTHGHSPWHFTGQASLDLNPGPLAISRTQ